MIHAAGFTAIASARAWRLPACVVTTSSIRRAGACSGSRGSGAIEPAAPLAVRPGGPGEILRGRCRRRTSSTARAMGLKAFDRRDPSILRPIWGLRIVECFFAPAGGSGWSAARHAGWDGMRSFWGILRCRAQRGLALEATECTIDAGLRDRSRTGGRSRPGIETCDWVLSVALAVRTMRHGKVTRLKTFLTEAEALEAAGLSE